MEKKITQVNFSSFVKILRPSKKYQFVFTFPTHTICTVDYKDLFFKGILLSDINFHFCPRWKIFDFEHKGLKNACFLIKLMLCNSIFLFKMSVHLHVQCSHHQHYLKKNLIKLLNVSCFHFEIKLKSPFFVLQETNEFPKKLDINSTASNLPKLMRKNIPPI